jgi:hypothetical protein
LVLDSLPAHKKVILRDYAVATAGRLTLHFLPRYAPDPNPDELVWSRVKRTGTARRPLQQGKKTAREDRGATRETAANAAPCPLIRPRSLCRLYCRLLSM